ncbi:CsbD family protein [Lactococcus muris]|uniref:CsbD family protein n=1 Tax=Lactococcus muris TaxID=2941330 RepID=A0ABV4DA31_9LACT|nr:MULTISPECIES: CsbD family protein [unclassified Lactococcus]
MVDKGTTDKLKGSAKEIVGDVTGDNKKKAEGFLDKTIGKVKEVAADIKEASEDAVEDVKEKLEHHKK